MSSPAPVRASTAPAHAAPRLSDLSESDVHPEALALLERVGGARLVRDMIALYTTYAPERLADARAALAAGDLDGVRRACHALRSGGAQLGLVSLAARCEDGEQLALAGQAEALAPLLGQLELAYQRGCVWLGRRPLPAGELSKGW